MAELIAAAIIATVNLVLASMVLFVMSLPFVAVFMIWQYLLG